MTRTFNLTPDRVEYLATVIEMGNSALGRQTNFDLVEQIQDALRDCPNGAAIVIEAHQ